MSHTQRRCPQYEKILREKLTLGFLLIGITVLGQEFEFDIHNTSLYEYIKLEERLGSERKENTSNNISFSGDAQPIVFIRKEKIIPNLTANYFFKKTDSTMSYIRYDWDESFYKNTATLEGQKPKRFQKALRKKSLQIEKAITKIYGEPETEGSLSDLSKVEIRKGLNKKNIWKPNDSFEIEMYTTISNFYEKRGMVTTTPTHRIRLYITNTNKEKKFPPKLSDQRLDTLKLISSNFIESLGNKNLTKSKTFLSTLIIENVTNEQLNSLIENWDFKKDTELIYSGIQVGLDGQIFTMLDFKYKDDITKPPKETLKIIFDDKDKIVGIQPIKLNGKFGG